MAKGSICQRKVSDLFANSARFEQNNRQHPINRYFSTFADAREKGYAHQKNSQLVKWLKYLGAKLQRNYQI